jgi:tRNA(Ile)-lysidine synthase
MLEKIRLALREECAVPPPATLVVGVSGGADSLCLMDALRRLDFGIAVAHFNHKLRPESDAEAERVRDVAARFGIKFLLGSADVRRAAGAGGRSLEEAARQLRYEFLLGQAREIGAAAVAVGHTADDQVETVLMHFIRGAGLKGLRGMQFRTILPAFDPSIPVIRPLLGLWREDTVAYCAANGLQASHDASNDSLDYFRNRLRHVLVPTLRTYNHRFRETILRSARALSSDQLLLDERLSAEWDDAVIRRSADYVAFDWMRLSRKSRGLRRHMIRLAAEHLAPDVETTFEALERAADFLADAARVRMDLTRGLTLFREGPVLYVTRGAPDLLPRVWPQMPASTASIRVEVPGRIALGGGWMFEADSPREAPPRGAVGAGSQDGFRAWLNADSLPQQIELRARRPGDRFRPMGLQGHSQKLADFMVNAKLPARARASWPLLCVGDTVIWIPGFRIAEEFKLLDGARRGVRFSLSQVN